MSLREDVDLVEKTLSGVARCHPKVLDEPPPIVRLDAILDSGFQFVLMVWVRDPPTTPRIASELRFAIAHAFAQAGVEFPTPELRLHTEPLRSEPVPAAGPESAETHQPNH